MTYQRVIPRDLFNEGNLLKCLGRVYINLEKLGLESTLQHDGEPFDVWQSSDDGALYVRNVVLVREGSEFVFRRPLNSRASWPLYLIVNEGADEVPVFNKVTGEFSNEMLNWLLDGRVIPC